MYKIDGITYASPFEHWHSPERNMSDIKEAVLDEHFEYHCPYCSEKLPWMDDAYEVDGKAYPQLFNEYLSSTPDGTIHDFDEVHCCPKCKKESYFRDGCL